MRKTGSCPEANSGPRKNSCKPHLTTLRGSVVFRCDAETVHHTHSPLLRKHIAHLLMAASLLWHVALRALGLEDLLSLCFVTGWRLCKAGHSSPQRCCYVPNNSFCVPSGSKLRSCAAMLPYCEALTAEPALNPMLSPRERSSEMG